MANAVNTKLTIVVLAINCNWMHVFMSESRWFCFWTHNTLHTT